MDRRPPRALVLTKVIAGKVSIADAALLLGISERSVRRLRSCLEASGPEALVHGNRGRRPANALDPAITARIVGLAKTTYARINDSHLADLLAEREGISVSRASIESVCCFKYARLVAQDNTVRLDGVVVQLPPRGTHWSWARQRVEVRQYLDGSFSVHAPGGRELARSAVPQTPPKLRAKGYSRAPIPGVQPLPKPGATSPWRKGYTDWRPAAAKRAMIKARSRPA